MDLNDYIAVRTGPGKTNLFHASLIGSGRHDGTYPVACKTLRSFRLTRPTLRFVHTPVILRCRKCLLALGVEDGGPLPPALREPERKSRAKQERRFAIDNPIKLNDVFDIATFFKHVYDYRRRHDVTIHELARSARISASTMTATENITLRVVLALASVCDLSIDSYRRDPL